MELRSGEIALALEIDAGRVRRGQTMAAQQLTRHVAVSNVGGVLADGLNFLAQLACFRREDAQAFSRPPDADAEIVDSVNTGRLRHSLHLRFKRIDKACDTFHLF